MKRLAAVFVPGFVFTAAGFVFTVYYLKLLWSFTDPRWGIPFLWFIPHGIKGLHFHHDIEFFITVPVAILLARAGLISRNAAFMAICFFFGMAVHHWWSEGLVLVSIDL